MFSNFYHRIIFYVFRIFFYDLHIRATFKNGTRVQVIPPFVSKPPTQKSPTFPHGSSDPPGSRKWVGEWSVVFVKIIDSCWKMLIPSVFRQSEFQVTWCVKKKLFGVKKKSTCFRWARFWIIRRIFSFSFFFANTLVILQGWMAWQHQCVL